jgi:lipopolysaccharide export system permease protein
MPALLYRYILSDLMRVFLLTASVLVLVIAFGTTIEPLMSNRLLTIGDTLKYLFLAVVPMLQFALPFSAGFASTMVLHRMTQDNEIMAAAASGISYRRLLAPIVAMGLGLTLVMVALTQFAIPRFWGIMEHIVAADATRMFQTSIESGAPFTMGNLQIHADSIRVVRNPPDTDAETRLHLSRVTAAELDADGCIDTDVTARRAVVDVHRPPGAKGQTFLKLVMIDTVVFDGGRGGTGQLAQSERIEPPRAIMVPSMLRDQLRTMSRTDLLRLRENPDRLIRITEEKHRIALHLRSDDANREVDRLLSEHGEMELVQAGPGRRTYVIRADGIESGRLRRVGGEPVEVHQFEGEHPLRRITAQQARLTRAPGGTLDAPSFELLLTGCEVTDLQDGLVNRRDRLVDHGLVLPRLSGRDYAELAAVEVVELAEERGLVSLAGLLRSRLTALDREITARLLLRYSQSVMAALLLVLGGILAMTLRGRLPLFIYVWAFVPSVLSLILASGGDKMMRDGEIVPGFAVMWSGNAAMLLILIVMYRRLMRN